jgi:N-acetylglutamate synthase-like GNAT family acetyltransferase
MSTNYTHVPSDIEGWKNTYEWDKKGTIDKWMLEKPFCDNPKDRIQTVKFIHPNDSFTKLSENLSIFAEQFPSISFYDTNIKFKFNKELRVTRNIRIICDYGYLTISIKDDGIELETIAIYPELQGKGYGFSLMCIFFLLLIDTFDIDNFPPIYLDCIGCATIKDEYVLNNVSNQCRFFRKFGFRVTNYVKSGKSPVIHRGTIQRFSDHAEMILDMDKFNSFYDFLSNKKDFAVIN